MKNRHIKLFVWSSIIFFMMMGSLATKVFAVVPCDPTDTVCLNQRGRFNPGPQSAGNTGGITNPVISPILGGSATDAASGATFTTYFITIWRALIVIGALATLFALVNGALEWITAGGQKDKVSHGRQKMTEALVGMVVLAGTFAIINFVSSLFGLNLLQFTLPTPDNASQTTITPQIP